MLADEHQLILGQRQSPHNVLDEVVRRDCCQVPLQLSQHHQFPFLKQRETTRNLRERARVIAWGTCDSNGQQSAMEQKAGPVAQQLNVHFRPSVLR